MKRNRIALTLIAGLAAIALPSFAFANPHRSGPRDYRGHDTHRPSKSRVNVNVHIGGRQGYVNVGYHSARHYRPAPVVVHRPVVVRRPVVIHRPPVVVTRPVVVHRPAVVTCPPVYPHRPIVIPHRPYRHHAYRRVHYRGYRGHPGYHGYHSRPGRGGCR